MPVIRTEKTDNFTVMDNYHLRDMQLSLKARGLLSLMLSLPDDWDPPPLERGETAYRYLVSLIRAQAEA